MVTPASTVAGGTIFVSASGLTRGVPYLVYAYGACLAGTSAANPVLIGPDADVVFADYYGGVASLEIDLPGDTSIGLGACSIVLRSVDGAEVETEPATVSVTSEGTPCTPDPDEGGLFEDLRAAGCERHHLPSQGSTKELADEYGMSVSALRKCLPAIRMTRAETESAISDRLEASRPRSTSRPRMPSTSWPASKVPSRRRGRPWRASPIASEGATEGSPRIPAAGRGPLQFHQAGMRRER